MSEVDPMVEFEAVLAQIEGEYEGALTQAADEHALRAANARFVGAQGSLTLLMKRMPELPGNRRKEFGQKGNALKQAIAAAFEGHLDRIARAIRQAELEGPALDVSLPSRARPIGRLHPIQRIQHELLDIFETLGFEVADGPDIDFHENCFDKLGFPPDHPATDMQDTFFVTQRERGDAATTLLRTHTSTIQVREMSRRKPPLAIVAPGTVYRRDDDATHSPMFHQIEAFVVDTDVTFADLKGVLQLFAQRLFHKDISVRVRPSYFPFVEPGGEVDFGCVFCRAWEGDAARTAACRVCKGSGWVEVLGCGMIHPVVFENVGYDPTEVSGFALGMGMDRLAMLKYGIPNIKLLYENDVRFLSAF
ncbi:MAG: phenylalanine--tRNA ligase subunit alpha [Polyangiales bacterium]|nr:phenylalanine--tRNA ligase subunit alpha [Myxococcales bacterium]MCB9662258.1 phenylalanine--tRNA ligase subunit alpha [Sandaracinaceae bacterium]